MEPTETELTVGLESPSPSPDFTGDAYVFQHSRREVGQSLNRSSGAKLITQRADGIRDDTADSCADGMADDGDGLGLHLSGANARPFVVERAQTIVLGYVLRCTL